MRPVLITLRLRFPFAHSLKDKRSEVQRLVNRLRSRYHVSVGESALRQSIKEAELMIAYLAADGAQTEAMKEKLLRFVEENTQGELIDVFVEHC